MKTSRPRIGEGMIDAGELQEKEEVSRPTSYCPGSGVADAGPLQISPTRASVFPIGARSRVEICPASKDRGFWRRCIDEAGEAGGPDPPRLPGIGDHAPHGRRDPGDVPDGARGRPGTLPLRRATRLLGDWRGQPSPELARSSVPSTGARTSSPTPSKTCSAACPWACAGCSSPTLDCSGYCAISKRKESCPRISSSRSPCSSPRPTRPP